MQALRQPPLAPDALGSFERRAGDQTTRADLNRRKLPRFQRAKQSLGRDAQNIRGGSDGQKGRQLTEIDLVHGKTTSINRVCLISTAIVIPPESRYTRSGVRSRRG